jgi:CDP-alcohol phosphatidyltransferase-like enzyme
MRAQIVERPSVVEATYKAREVEGILDLYFYRRIGFWLAQLFAKLKITPAGVSLLGGLCGVLAGHLYYYRDLRTNIAGMILHVWANALDNADGQLARLTGSGSLHGRVIDSLFDHLIWVSIYVHLGLRCLSEGPFLAIAPLAFAAGLSHGLQGAAADYYRTCYLFFVKGRIRADLNSSVVLRSDYQELSWRSKPWNKFLLASYLNFTRQQEMLAPNLKKLRDMADRVFPNQIPDWLKRRYEIAARPMFKWWSLLMTNTRMLLLFALLLIDQPIWYFWIELTVFNLLLLYLVLRQENMSQLLLTLVATRRDSA